MKNYKKITFTLLVILLPALFVNLYAQKSIELKYNVSRGDLYKTVMHMDQDIVFDANGQTMALDQIIDFKMTTEVTDNTEDEFTTKSTVDAVKMTQSIFGMQITYDSEDSTTLQNPMVAKIAEAMGGMIGASYTMVMDHKGHVKEIDASAFSQNDDIANNISSGSGYAIYKEGKVKVGDSWDGDVTPLKNSDMKVNMTYTVLKISGKEVTLGIDGTIKANNMEDQELNLDGTMSGEMIVSSHTGWLIKSVIDQEIKLDIEQNGQTMPATITGTITTTSEKVK
jgi:hypothetical protein